jgi:hypothetical protein
MGRHMNYLGLGYALQDGGFGGLGAQQGTGLKEPGNGFCLSLSRR